MGVTSFGNEKFFVMGLFRRNTVVVGCEKPVPAQEHSPRLMGQARACFGRNLKGVGKRPFTMGQPVESIDLLTLGQFSERFSGRINALFVVSCGETPLNIQISLSRFGNRMTPPTNGQRHPKDDNVDLTVITATWQRPKLLALCLAQFQQQKVGSLSVEHVVVSDGPDPLAGFLAEQAGARYVEQAEHKGRWGTFAKDRGIKEARGGYVCFWDDDNLYEPHALADGSAVHVLAIDLNTPGRLLGKRALRLAVIPRNWTGTFRFGQVDTMCVCVRRDFAVKERWAEPEDHGPGDDYRWLARLQRQEPTICFAPIIVGTHL